MVSPYERYRVDDSLNKRQRIVEFVWQEDWAG